jgi:hypothetical protein
MVHIQKLTETKPMSRPHATQHGRHHILTGFPSTIGMQRKKKQHKEDITFSQVSDALKKA